MNHKIFLSSLAAVTVLATACGDTSDEQFSGPEPDSTTVGGSIDLADLPDDYPRELMPPDYDKADYVDLRAINGTRATTFESNTDVQESIDYYIDLLGEPKINVDSGDGDRLVQWHMSPYPPWVVGVMGNADESIVTVSTLPEQ